MKVTALFFLVFFQTIIFRAQEKAIEVWPSAVPGYIENADYSENKHIDEGVVTGISKVTEPTLTVFKPDVANGTSVIIFPGGGYSHLAIDKEGFKVAKWLNGLGITAFVLKYRLPSDLIMKKKEVGPLQDAQESVRIVRRNAQKWNLNPNKIGVMGFSAGGHLASTITTKYNFKVYNSDTTSARPDFSIFIYPVVSMKESVTHEGSKNNLLGKNASKDLIEEYSNELNVNSDTPSVFLVHATDDHAVPIENSINYYLAARAAGVPAELHAYEDGGHGFGMGRQLTANQWPEMLVKWLKKHKLLEKDSLFLFSYFKGNGEDGLHLAYSENGKNWNTLNNDQSFLKPELGNEKLMRDPCIIKVDGEYHMVWTVGWKEKGIGYASSKDLIEWSNQKFIPVMENEENARNCWAPEITYDKQSKEYLIYWASTIHGKFNETAAKGDEGYNHRIYYTKTKDFKTFSQTQLLFDPGFNIIDATIKKYNGIYYMFLKDETRNPAQKNIKIATAHELSGPYSNVTSPITGNYWAEGPTVAKINDYWYVYFDKYTDKKYGAVRSKDLKNWEDVSAQIKFPLGTRHGSVLPISKNALKKLRNSF
ncbi:family 43 glycosylhydrolase [Gramella sp. AN32]|uniref:Family 43 glycosylhydrolase n=1 Tax=Christiangramia antarctica TaxID=2058158 RepID=A0ABW5X1Z6_9FLAO|nr:family 43 glycosylhydrolase [Gramella sp. AN32]MCM4157225.1 beta-galactosidase [Gramella sp. AN32]